MNRDYVSIESGKGALFWAFPQNTHWSFTVSRIIGLIDFGGANFSEILQATSRMVDGDEDSWYSSWSRLGDQLERLAQQYWDHGNRQSYVKALHRSCNYHRMAQFFFTSQHESKVESLKKSNALFEKTLAYLPVNASSVTIPYQGHDLPGYFFSPRTPGTAPRPAIVYVNGADSLPSEAYFTAGQMMAESGYHFLVYEAPGVGLSLYERGIPTTFESEKFVSPAIDWLVNRPEVDPSKFILMGESFAGYLVPRAAAFEPRTSAIVVSSPIYQYEAYRRYLGSGKAFRHHLLRLFGCETPEELRIVAESFTLSGILERVRCPALLIQGSEDPLIVSPVTEALHVLEEIGTPDKRLLVYETGGGLGGFTHCQKDNLHLFHADTISWLYDHGLAGQDKELMS